MESGVVDGTVIWGTLVRVVLGNGGIGTVVVGSGETGGAAVEEVVVVVVTTSDGATATGSGADCGGGFDGLIMGLGD